MVIPLNDNYQLVDIYAHDLPPDIETDYKFAHDRIQQAVYSLISAAEQQVIHHRVGQLLLQHTPLDEQEQHIFDIVNQLNLGLSLIQNQAKKELAQLNLIAGKKAKASAAYQIASDYLLTGLKLLTPAQASATSEPSNQPEAVNSGFSHPHKGNWQQCYDLTLALSIETAETAYLNGDFATMEYIAAIILEEATSLLDKVRVYEVKINAFLSQNKLLDSVKTALPVLKLLGQRFPEQPNTLHIVGALLKTKVVLWRKRPEDLLNLPPMTDPHALAAMRVLLKAATASYLTVPNLLPLFLVKMITLSLKYGNAHEIQQSLLPPPHPNWPHLDVICYNTPAREVGGDFYCYHTFESPVESIEKHNVKYALAIGDVSGKGVSAALLMATSLSQFDAALSLDFTPTARLAHLDKMILPYTKPRGQNCAMCYIEISQKGDTPHNYELTVINAGGIAPYIKRHTGQVEEIEAGGFALGQGLGLELGYQKVKTDLVKGDTIILSSDGVVEAKNDNDQMFGFERLEQTIANGPTNSSEAMLNHLRANIKTFVNHTEPHDDLTMIIIKV